MTSQSSTIELPYGDGALRIALPVDRPVDVYLPRDEPAVADAESEVRRAMADPIGSAPLAELAAGRHTVAIVIDDATRPVPTAAMLRPVVETLREAGIAEVDVTVVVATGLHRPMTGAEAAAVLDGLPLRLVNHDPRDPKELVDLGTTSRGTPLRVNRTVAEADLKILTGDVELHQFVGYGGGAKSVLPGVSDVEGIETTHAKMDTPGAGPGRIDDNPVRLDIEEAADRLGVDFLVNVVLNGRHEVVRAVAGDVHRAFQAGIAWVDRMFKVEVPEPVDLVLCTPGGYPKDIDLYQSQKAIRSARRIVRRGGTIVAVAECREGHGSETAYRWACEAATPEEIIARSRERFVMGGHKACQLAVDARWATVYLHSSLPEAVAEAFFLRPLQTVAEIESLLARAASIAVLPQAALTLPLLPGQVLVDF